MITIDIYYPTVHDVLNLAVLIPSSTIRRTAIFGLSSLDVMSRHRGDFLRVDEFGGIKHI